MAKESLKQCKRWQSGNKVNMSREQNQNSLGARELGKTEKEINSFQKNC